MRPRPATLVRHALIRHALIRNALTLSAALILGATVHSTVPAFAVDTVSSTGAPDLTSVRASIKAKNFAAARDELAGMINSGVQHADVYSLMGFATRNLGDVKTALTFYNKAFDYDPDHKGAREYLGELFVKTGDLVKAREQLAILVKLCPTGCEERADLEKAIAAASTAIPNG